MDANRIVIVDRDSGEPVDRCAGPGPGGGCAREPSGASVACAGKLLRVDGAPSTVPDFVVPEGFDVCPVTWVLALSGAASSSFLDG